MKFDDARLGTLPEASSRTSRRLQSLIWLLPLVAIATTSWIMYKTFVRSTIDIELHLTNPKGLVPGKTQVVLEGYEVGILKSLSLNQDLRTATAHLAIDRDAKDALREETRFWVVRAQVSLINVENLDTLISGSYLMMQPGQGDPSRSFNALENPPPVHSYREGLVVHLKANEAPAVTRGAPVLYKKIPIGEITDIQLPDQGNEVMVTALVKPAFAHLVRSNSRFSLSSGFEFNGGLKGLSFKADALITILKGGVVMTTPDFEKGTRISSGHFFPLLEEDSALAAHRVTLVFDEAAGLDRGTPLKWKGFQLGEVTDLRIDTQTSKVYATLQVRAEAIDLMRSGARFWVVRPEISLEGIKGLETLIQGIEIAMSPGKGAPQKEFVVSTEESVGLPLVLTTLNQVSGIRPGGPVTYRGIVIGRITSVMPDAANAIQTHVLIKPEYAHLVGNHARFWQSGGFSVDASLSGVDVRSEDFLSLVIGGIRMGYDLNDHGKPARKGQEFQLFADRRLALGRFFDIQLRLTNAEALSIGTPVRYRGLDIGEVENLSLASDTKNVLATLRIKKAYRHLINAGSRFWIEDARFNLKEGVKNLQTVVTGGWIAMEAGYGASRDQFTALEAPPENYAPGALRITLVANNAKGLRAGLPVQYRFKKVGSIEDVRFSSNAKQVLVDIIINPVFKSLIRKNTRFWNTSGIDMRWGFFRGFEFETTTLESLAIGGVSLATPDQVAAQSRDGDQFELFDAPEDEWLEWQPSIALWQPDEQTSKKTTH